MRGERLRVVAVHAANHGANVRSPGDPALWLLRLETGPTWIGLLDFAPQQAGNCPAIRAADISAWAGQTIEAGVDNVTIVRR
jgi:hypothetical protein